MSTEANYGEMIFDKLMRIETKFDQILAQHEALRMTNRELAARCAKYARERASARRALTNHLKEKLK